MSRSLLRTALELRSPITRLPPTFLLPLGARWLSTSPPQQPSSPASSSPSLSIPPTTPPPTTIGSSPSSLEASRAQQTSAVIHARAAAETAAETAAAAAAAATSSSSSTTKTTKTTTTTNSSNRRTPPLSPPPPRTGPVPARVKALLPLLRAQPGQYITVHIHARPYLVTVGDIVRLPFLMPGVLPGDVLRLNRASVLGSRDLTLRPADPQRRAPLSNEPAYIDERLFECRATVVGVDSEPMREKKKTKRRNRKVKTIKSKHRYTVLRISELRIRSLEELEAEEEGEQKRAADEV